MNIIIPDFILKTGIFKFVIFWIQRKDMKASLWILITISLYWISTINYLLFHSLVEIFSISIAFMVFILTWNSRKYLKSNYLVLLGIAYLFIGILDLFHTLSYKGMSIFKDYDYYANQLWIATRFIESITFLAAMLLIRTKKHVNVSFCIVFYTIITGLILGSIFIWRIFPVCFADGTGLTVFKKISEYVISLILFVSLMILRSNKDKFTSRIYYYILFSIVLTILSELAFTFYISNYGFSNLVGHFFKLASFYLIYKAIIMEGIQSPYELIFKDLMDKEAIILEQNRKLQDLSNKDRMTELYNHEYIFEELDREIKRARRYNYCLSIIMLDLDNFKHFNDKYGHPEGDKVLTNTAHIIRDSIRETDTAGRYGGEEFLVILPQTDKEQGLLVAEKIRVSIESSLRNYSVTISGGIASLDEAGGSSELVSLADRRLYVSKAEGKNRVT